MTRTLRLSAAAALLALLTAPLTAGTTYAAGTTTLKPTALERGENPAVPFAIGTTILDGDTEVDVDAQELQLLGRSGDDYVAVVYGARDSAVERISPAGEREVLVERLADDQVLSDDGERLVEIKLRSSSHTVARVRDAVTGTVVARHEFRGFAYVLDADGDQVVMGAASPDRTISWEPDTDQVTRLSRHRGVFADLGADLLATLKGDPLEGRACSRLTSLSDRSATLWRSCEELPFEASPDGTKVATVLIGQDGPLSEVEVHATDGTLLRTYRSVGDFGPLAWEDDDSLLLTTWNRRQRGAVVRCDGGQCDRASDVVRRY